MAILADKLMAPVRLPLARGCGSVAGLMLLLVTSSLMAQVPRAEYRMRRDEARKALQSSVIVLFGRTASEMEQHSVEGLQDPDFHYLAGWDEPGAILLLSPQREMLFLPAHNPDREKYTGRMPAATDPNIAGLTGFEEVLPLEQFEAQLARALESNARILAQDREPYLTRLKSLAPLREIANAENVVGLLRMKKSAAEIAAIEHSTAVSVEAHLAAWRRARPGLFEYQIAATMTFAMLDQGCEGNAYDPIVASGLRATTLHYAENARRVEDGELVLMDVGSRCAGYATDITRTIPANGKFTPRQRELYEIVLGAEKAAIAAIRPGLTMAELNKVAREYLDSHGKDRSGAPLGKYLTHRISHGVGLDVHDYPTAASTAPFEAGMVITTEPGLYIPEENIGIRIEDTVLVTKDGAKVLSAGLPKEADEVEKVMVRGAR